MTTNQIEFQKHLETMRSNRANEALTQARDEETKRRNAAVEAETYRSNYANEQIKRDSNVINAASLEEQARANRAKETQNYLNYVETARHNIESEAAAATSAQAQLLRGQAAKESSEASAQKVTNDFNLGTLRFELDRDSAKRQLDQKDRDLNIQQRNADTNRLRAYTDLADKGLNYIIPKKGVRYETINEDQSTGSKIKDTIKGLFK